MKNKDEEEYIDEDDPLFVECSKKHKFATSCGDFMNKKYDIPCPVCAGWKEDELYKCSPDGGETWFFVRQHDKEDKMSFEKWFDEEIALKNVGLLNPHGIKQLFRYAWYDGYITAKNEK